MVQRAYMQVYEVNGKFTVDISAQREGQVSLFLSSKKAPEFKLNGITVNKDILDCFDELHTIIKDNYEGMKKHYKRHAFIINKEVDVDQGEDTNYVRQTFIPCYNATLENGYSVEVTEKQHGDDPVVSRNFYICDEEGNYKFLVESISGNIEEISPIEPIIDAHKNEWIERLEKEVVHAVRKELQNIKENIEEIVLGNKILKSFAYEDGTFCIQKIENDESTFTKYKSYSEMNNAMADIVEKELKITEFEGSTQGKIRLHLNNGRRYLADGKDMLFISEMGTIKGILISSSKSSMTTVLQQLKLHEKGFDTFVEKYKFITGTDML